MTRRSTNVDDYMRVPRPIAAMAKDFPHGHHIPVARHERGQLVYAVAGVMTVTTPHGTWVVPPQRASGCRRDTDHESRMSGRVQMRTLYLRRDAAARLPGRCCVMNVTPLRRELVLAARRCRVAYDERGRDGRVMRLILDELRTAGDLPLHLPLPGDRRLARICDAILKAPADTRPLEAGPPGSARAHARSRGHFRQETGMASPRGASRRASSRACGGSPPANR